MTSENNMVCLKYVFYARKQSLDETARKGPRSSAYASSGLAPWIMRGKLARVKRDQAHANHVKKPGRWKYRDLFNDFLVLANSS